MVANLILFSSSNLAFFVLTYLLHVQLNLVFISWLLLSPSLASPGLLLPPTDILRPLLPASLGEWGTWEGVRGEVVVGGGTPEDDWSPPVCGQHTLLTAVANGGRLLKTFSSSITRRLGALWPILGVGYDDRKSHMTQKSQF